MARLVHVIVWALVLALTLLVSRPGVASFDEDVDGFDEPSDSVTLKTATDISAVNLNPFQVEVFISFCAQ